MGDCEHHKTHYDGNCGYHMSAWSIPSESFEDNRIQRTEGHEILKGFWYNAVFRFTEDKISFSIVSRHEDLKCSVWMYIDSGTMLLSGSLKAATRYDSLESANYYDLITLTCFNERFQNLKQRTNYTLVFVYRVKWRNKLYQTNSLKRSKVDSLYHLQTLKNILKYSPASELKERVVLQVGEETELVSKTVLRARSPVFDKMFENDMKEVQNNTVNVTDIRMPVLKAFISFCFSGKLPTYDFGFLCDLYYAADKYDMADLREQCVDLLLTQISEENIIRVLKLAFRHNVARLKFTAMTWILSNVETWILTNDWKMLVMEEPQIAVEILEFSDF